MACLYSSENVVIALIYCRPTMYIEFHSPLAVCLRVNMLSNALQDVMRKCILLSVYALPFILCFVFVETIFFLFLRCIFLAIWFFPQCFRWSTLMNDSARKRYILRTVSLFYLLYAV